MKSDSRKDMKYSSDKIYRENREMKYCKTKRDWTETETESMAEDRSITVLLRAREPWNSITIAGSDLLFSRDGSVETDVVLI